MTFDEVLDQVRALLQQRGRVTYRALQRRFALDEEYLADLKGELIKAEGVAADEGGEVLVWIGQARGQATEKRAIGEAEKEQIVSSDARRQPLDPSAADGERRQLTVMFCDLVGSTALSTQLDPEELRAVIRAYRETCASAISQFGGYLAKYIGDGLLVYFGYPVAHEDDAQRAVRTALGIVKAIHHLSFPTIQLPRPLQVRVGIHTGLVVAGEMGVGDQPEPLAIVGETPNIAARLQEHAQPNRVVISPTTYRLVTGLFECQELGPQVLKGLSQPLALYQVVRESAAQSRFEVAVQKGLTPLVGRGEELALLQRRWEQTKAGAGQVVLLSGEPGIGKSRLVQELKEHVSAAGATRIEFHCSPYHQNSALYPIIDHLQRLLQFTREDSPAVKLEKLQHRLSHYRFPQADAPSLLAALLSLPHPAGYPPLTMSPQKQKEKTQAALVAWLIEEAEQNTVYTVWEDLHWADPSTLEVLTLLLDQVPTTRVLVLLTCRPEFMPTWGNRSHLTPLTLSRLGRRYVETMVEQVTGGKALSSAVRQQIVAKTDGVPLFVEELTKMVVESESGIGEHYNLSLPLGIPTTLQDALMARLDRLNTTKEIAQVGAVLGREFSYDLLHAVSPFDETMLQQGLRQLVEAELLYQRGLPPQATYVFKHALIQDVAYQSLLKSKRQQCHSQITQVLEQWFAEIKETQPELLAHHYTEAGLIAQALPYWQQAGERATQRSAYVEAIAHLTKGLEVLKTLPDTPKRTQYELGLQVALGVPLIAMRGYTVPEVERTYERARELCLQVKETPQLANVLWALWVFNLVSGKLHSALEIADRYRTLAERTQQTALLLETCQLMGLTLFYLGDLRAARPHLERGVALYDPQQHHALIFAHGGADTGVAIQVTLAPLLWQLGYPSRARAAMLDALTLAHKLSHPFSSAFALTYAALLHRLRREGRAAQERAEAVITLCREQEFPYWLAAGTILRGWALAEQGQGEEGITQIRQGIADYQATGAELAGSYFLALLAEAYGKGGQAEEGLRVLAEALAMVEKKGERSYEAELYRLKGELTLARSSVQGLAPSVVQKEAEVCFRKAIEVARRQSAKSLELRAVMSLSRLWQKQGRKEEARKMLAEIYYWFTEGFDTKDLQEAKALLEELS